ncbi:hypothetical protein FBY30_0978 [Arthrobacter sp. SLBN-83]|uniref:hypothetical protein n=1 Tax=Arthrobacter sp. SLBN-83 TaxID=2768449 RepID=UPI001150DF10|nr:hypothetical protein [Arthrobacter sp. SLBN-83]TQJ58743.1 hypothetical protein FBY30_0978 [Arthrobacter sp. SLBN-83]
MESTQAAVPRTRGSALTCLAGPLATALGLAGHVAGGGASPAVVIVVALAALLGLGAVLLERLAPPQLPGWAVLAASAVAQQLLHLAFSAFSTASAVPLPGHDHGAGSAPGVPSSSAAAPAVHSLHLMLYLHAGAALGAAAVVAQWSKVSAWVRARIRT